MSVASALDVPRVKTGSDPRHREGMPLALWLALWVLGGLAALIVTCAVTVAVTRPHTAPADPTPGQYSAPADDSIVGPGRARPVEKMPHVVIPRIGDKPVQIPAEV